jgi:hypothetical protein
MKRRRIHQVIIPLGPDEMPGFKSVEDFAVPFLQGVRPKQPVRPGGNGSGLAPANKSDTAPNAKPFVYRIPEDVFENVWDLCERHKNYTPLRILTVLIKLWFETYRCNPVRLTSCRLQKLGIERRRKYRALKLLKESGLISVAPIPGANPLVVLNWLPRKENLACLNSG